MSKSLHNDVVQEMAICYLWRAMSRKFSVLTRRSPQNLPTCSKLCQALAPNLARKLTRLIQRPLQILVRRARSPTATIALATVCLICCGCTSLQSFQDLSKTRVVSARQWARSGFEAMHQGRFRRAKSFFSKGGNEIAGDPRSLANLARAELQRGNVERSILVMEQAVEEFDDPALRCELGEIYLRSGRWIAANEHADKAIEKDRHFTAAWNLKGKLAAAKGEHQRALQLFQRSLAYDSESDDIQMQIAETYMKLDQPMRALSAAETLLNRHPPNRQPESAIIAKSEALLAMRQHPAAIDILEIASNRPDCSKEVFFQLGKAQLDAGQRSQARLTLAKGKQRFPDEELFTQLAGALNELPNVEFAAPHRVASVKAEGLR